MKKYMLVGAMGAGKSSTGNKLLEKDVFDVGDEFGRVTTEISIQPSDNGELCILDCPGFGDLDVDLLNIIQSSKARLINESPLDGFFLVVKFNQDDSLQFSHAAKQFHEIFGTNGLKSLVLLCIQGSPKRRYSQGKFQSILYNTDGYKYLKSNNNNQDIPYCLWDNYREYFNQTDTFKGCLARIQPFEKNNMINAFDLIAANLRAKKSYTIPIDPNNSWCNLL